MKKLFITTLFLCCALFAMAQSGKVVITVLDAQSKQGIAGAIIDIAPVSKPDKAKQYISAYGGKTSLPTMSYGEYDITVSFLGYETKTEKIGITAANREKITIELSEESTRIETVAPTAWKYVPAVKPPYSCKPWVRESPRNSTSAK